MVVFIGLDVIKVLAQLSVLGFLPENVFLFVRDALVDQVDEFLLLIYLELDLLDVLVHLVIAVLQFVHLFLQFLPLFHQGLQIRVLLGQFGNIRILDSDVLLQGAEFSLELRDLLLVLLADVELLVGVVEGDYLGGVQDGVHRAHAHVGRAGVRGVR